MLEMVFAMHKVLTIATRVGRVGMSTCTTSESNDGTVPALIDNFSSTLVYPRCTPSSVFEKDSDCGSAGWAFALFIAWNLLSMVSSFQSCQWIKFKVAFF